MTNKIQSDLTFDEVVLPEQEPLYSIKDYISKIWDLGLITFGGPMSHIGIFRKRLVQQMKCIKEQKFVELLTICQSLPGPTSTQLLTAISMYATASFWGGFLAFLMFSLPAFIGMFTAVLFLRQFTSEWIFSYVLPGLRVVAIAVILQAFVGLYTKIAHQYVLAGIVFISALAYYIKPTTAIILIEFVIAGGVGFYYVKVPDSQSNYSIPSRFKDFVYGFKNLIMFFVVLVACLVSLPYLTSRYAIIFALFYKIGSLVIGGGHVILPIMYSEFQPYNFMTQDQFYNGFSLISIMPGPMFNLCIYVGGIITKNIWGSLAAFIGLYLPCYFFTLFILPYWETYRQKKKIKAIIQGVCSASIGLILTAAIILYQQEVTSQSRSGFLWFLLITLIVVLSYGLLHYNYSILLVFALGDLAYILASIIFQKL